jgi:hypothetical protein
MASIVLNIGLGRAREFVNSIGTANAALVVIPIEASGLETDAVLRDKADLAAFLAGSTNEQLTMGRKVITSVIGAVDNSSDRYTVDCADITWTGATGNPISKLLYAYDSDTTTGTDANIVPWVLVDYPSTPDGSDIIAGVANFLQLASAA